MKVNSAKRKLKYKKKRLLLSSIFMLLLQPALVQSAPSLIGSNDQDLIQYSSKGNEYKYFLTTTGEELKTTTVDGKTVLEATIANDPVGYVGDFDWLAIHGVPLDKIIYNFQDNVSLITPSYNEGGVITTSFEENIVFNMEANKKLEVLFTPGDNNYGGIYITNNSSFTVNNGDVILRAANSDYAFDSTQGVIRINTQGWAGSAPVAGGLFLNNINKLHIINENEQESDWQRAIYVRKGTLNINSNDMRIYSTNAASRFDIGIQANGGSNLDIKANNLYIDAETALAAQDDNCNVAITAKNAVFTGGIQTYGNSSVKFLKDDSLGRQQLNITVDGQDAVTANPSDYPDFLRGDPQIDFNINTVINAQGGDTSYANKPGRRLFSAIRANRNSTVNLKETDQQYQIYGDIIAGRGIEHTDKGGQVDIGGSGSIIKGDVLAGNTGEINLSLKDGALLEGRVDDYADASIKDNIVFRPDEFEIPVTEGGTVNMKINDSTWIARHQSFVSSLEFGSDGGLVDMTKEENSSITIDNLSGNGKFKMLLDAANKGSSDMLFVTNDISGQQTIEVQWKKGTNGINDLEEGERLRFSTTNDAQQNTITARSQDKGFFNIEYLTDTDDYDAAGEKTENEIYNGKNNGENSNKPGNDFADAQFDNGGINHYIVGIKAQKPSDAGKTIINMSRSNYANAIYMDRLNKRIGEAKYINEEETGLWVRLRHDRIGKADAFRSRNTMYELGYDEKQECANGNRRVGAAIDYMNGKTSYNDIWDDGKSRRYGIWFYDTWQGNKGHYSDYVAKFGHLKHDFGITATTSGEKITGAYSNNVFSVSAEYGRTKNLDNDWYFEPQAQLQLARVTGSSYATSQDTMVNLTGINTLIGRAGFRMGKNLNKTSSIYFKADLLHEFLGKQKIGVRDTTAFTEQTYKNQGTWYDIGFGFTIALNNNSYAFLDFEQSLGNDNDNTYQINAGLQWTFQ